MIAILSSTPNKDKHTCHKIIFSPRETELNVVSEYSIKILDLVEKGAACHTIDSMVSSSVELSKIMEIIARKECEKFNKPIQTDEKLFDETNLFMEILPEEINIYSKTKIGSGWIYTTFTTEKKLEMKFYTTPVRTPPKYLVQSLPEPEPKPEPEQEALEALIIEKQEAASDDNFNISYSAITVNSPEEHAATPAAVPAQITYQQVITELKAKLASYKKE